MAVNSLVVTLMEVTPSGQCPVMTGSQSLWKTRCLMVSKWSLSVVYLSTLKPILTFCRIFKSQFSLVFNGKMQSCLLNGLWAWTKGFQPSFYLGFETPLHCWSVSWTWSRSWQYECPLWGRGGDSALCSGWCPVQQELLGSCVINSELSVFSVDLSSG